MYSVFTCIPGESYHGQLRSLLLCLCDVFRSLINFLFVDSNNKHTQERDGGGGGGGGGRDAVKHITQRRFFCAKSNLIK